MKKKTIYITILFFAFASIPYLLKANNYFPKDSTKQKKLHWGINASLLYGGYYFNNYDKSNVWVKEEVNYLDSIMIPNYGFAIGFSAEKYLCKNLSLKAGLSVKSFNFKTKEQYHLIILSPTQIIPDTIYFYDKYNVLYIALPISANYYFFTRNKLSLFIGAGVSLSLPIAGDIESVYKCSNCSYMGGGDEYFTYPPLDGNGNSGLILNLNKLKISIAFTFNYSLLFDKNDVGVGGNYTYSQHLYSYGLNLNLTF